MASISKLPDLEILSLISVLPFPNTSYFSFPSYDRWLKVGFNCLSASIGNGILHMIDGGEKCHANSFHSPFARRKEVTKKSTRQGNWGVCV